MTFANHVQDMQFLGKLLLGVVGVVTVFGLCFIVVVMDSLTHGGLFKNRIWQFVRRLWMPT